MKLAVAGSSTGRDDQRPPGAAAMSLLPRMQQRDLRCEAGCWGGASAHAQQHDHGLVAQIHGQPGQSLDSIHMCITVIFHDGECGARAGGEPCCPYRLTQARAPTQSKPLCIPFLLAPTFQPTCCTLLDPPPSPLSALSNRE